MKIYNFLPGSTTSCIDTKNSFSFFPFIIKFVWLFDWSFITFPLFCINFRIKKLIDLEALGLSRLAVIVLDIQPDVKGYSLFSLPQVRFEPHTCVNFPNVCSILLFYALRLWKYKLKNCFCLDTGKLIIGLSLIKFILQRWILGFVQELLTPASSRRWAANLPLWTFTTF